MDTPFGPTASKFTSLKATPSFELKARLIMSLGQPAFFAESRAEARRMFELGSVPPLLAALEICLLNFVNKAPRATSLAPLERIIFENLECPAKNLLIWLIDGGDSAHLFNTTRNMVVMREVFETVTRDLNRPASTCRCPGFEEQIGKWSGGDDRRVSLAGGIFGAHSKV